MDNLLSHLQTQLPGVWWPRFPSPQANAILATLYQLEQAQSLPAAWHRQQQLQQAGRLLAFAAKNVPYYRTHLPHDGPPRALCETQWLELPLLSRKQVQQAGRELVSDSLPKRHGELVEISTSGSTGMPVTCYTTHVTRFMYLVNMCREHFWHRRDFTGTHMGIRPDGKVPPGQVRRGRSWGAGVVESGPSLLLNVRTDVRRQLELLQREDPDYLLSLPSNLKVLAELCREKNVRLANLKGIRCYGEILPEETRQICAATWEVPVTDIYSSQEVGIIAFQCPEQGSLHALTDGLLIEVLHDDGTPCGIGETGQVVVTPLLNYGNPLLRYALGDYAEVGAPCPCGRAMPVLNRVLGRQRNMLNLPGGGRLWPSFAVREWAKDLPLSQFQFVQKAIDRIEARLVCERPLTEAEEARLTQALHQRLTYPFEVELCYMDEIPRSASGKFEDFVSEV